MLCAHSVSSLRLTSTERERLRHAALALAANPFTPERASLDLALTSGVPGEDVFQRTVAELEQTASRCLTVTGREQLSAGAFEQAFRAYLFALFHRYVPAMSQLIDAEERGDGAAAPFASEVLAALEQHLVPRTRAERLLALLYQTQRAFLALVRELRGPSPSMRRLRASLWNAVFTHDVTRYEAALWDRMEDFS